LNLEGSLSVLVCNINESIFKHYGTYWLGTVGSVVGSGGGNIDVVNALGRLESHVVVAGLVVLAEAELGGGSEEALGLLRLAKGRLQHF